MKVRPIMFTETAESVASGIKSETRRIAQECKLHPKSLCKKQGRNHFALIFNNDGLFWTPYGGSGVQPCPQHIIEEYCPYGKPDDILWVKETWAHGSDSLPYVYKSGYPKNIPQHFENIPDISEIKWKSPRFMPKDAARTFLKIIKVRFERLHEISEISAIKEGAASSMQLSDVVHIAEFSDTDYAKKLQTNQIYFMALWAKINGVESLLANPWVWVIEFEKIDKPAFIN